MASSAKRLRTANLSTEMDLEMMFEREKDRLGMQNNKGSEPDQELECESEIKLYKGMRFICFRLRGLKHYDDAKYGLVMRGNTLRVAFMRLNSRQVHEIYP